MLANYEQFLMDSTSAADDGMPPVLVRALEDYCANRPAGTTRGVRSAFSRYFTWARLHKNERSMIGTLEAWGRHLVAEGVKPASARVQMSRVSSVLRQFFKNEDRLEQIEALRYVDKPEKQLGERAHFWLIPEQSQALLKAPDAMTTKGIRDRAILACMLGAALRREEVAGLAWTQIQFRNSHYYFVDIRGKRNRLRSFPIPPFVHRALQKWFDTYHTDDRVFCSFFRGQKPRGEMNGQTVWRVVEEYCDRLGFVKIVDGKQVLPRPHDLRRTFARSYVMGGGDLKELQQILGHASIQTTERYVGALERPDVAQPAQYLPYSL